MTLQEEIMMILNDPEKVPMSLAQIVTEEISEFKASPEYQIMVEAEWYYRNRSDVQNKQNDLKNRSNTRIEHPVLRKLIKQKADYLLSKPFSVVTEDTRYGEALGKIFDNTFRKKIKSLGLGAVKSGIAYIQPYFDDGKIKFMRMPSTEIKPLWADAERSKMDAFIRFYDQIVYEGTRKTTITRAEFWFSGGVKYFVKDSRSAPAFAVDRTHGTKENDWTEPHFMIGDKAYNFETPPIAWLRYNEEELPLFYFLKELIDDMNWQTSVTADALRDVAKFIYVLRNYGGQDLDEFVRDLREALAIKVDGDGGVDKLAADLNIDAVMAFLDKNRRDLYDYGNGVDTKDPDLGNASGTAINFRYMDLDNDCASLASELQGTFQTLKLFIDAYLQATGQGDFTESEFSIQFNSDLPVNETDIINNVRNSDGIISKRTMLENHPWVEDVDEELEAIKKEKEEALAEFGEGLFHDSMGGGTDGNQTQDGGVTDGEEK